MFGRGRKADRKRIEELERRIAEMDSNFEAQGAFNDSVLEWVQSVILHTELVEEKLGLTPQDAARQKSATLN